jgi:hypothetical protein
MNKILSNQYSLQYEENIRSKRKNSTVEIRNYREFQEFQTAPI